MKKILITAACLLGLNSVYAENIANLQMKISGDIKNTYYFCVNNAGCVNLAAAKRKSLPINTGNVDYMFMTNAANIRMYPQTLPDSCAVTVNGNQTLTVFGTVTKVANDKIYISHLHCAVA